MSIREVKHRRWSPIVIRGPREAIAQLKSRDFVHVISKGLVVYPGRTDGLRENHNIESRFSGI